MVTPELLDFLRAQLSTGMSPEQVERLLVQEGGWDKADVEEGLLAIGHPSQLAKEPAVLPPSIPPAVTPVPEIIKEVLKEVTPPLLPPSVLASKIEEPKVPAVLTVRSEREKTTKDEDEDFLGILSALPTVQSPATGKSEEKISPSEKTPASVSVTPPSSPPAFKFDLSQIRKSNEVISLIPSVPSTPESITPPLATKEMQPSMAAQKITEKPTEKAKEKPIETRSVAELWLAKETGNTQPETLASASSENEASRRSTLATRRTMGSDVLLRGKGATIQGLPALGVPQGITPITPLSPSDANLSGTPKPPLVMPPLTMGGNSAQKNPDQQSLADTLAHKNKVKKIIGITAGTMITIAFVVAGVIAYLSVRSPDVLGLLSSAMTNFSAAPSLLYSGAFSTDITLTNTTEGITRTGVVKSDASYQGELLSSKNGFGDGNHHVRFTGGLQSGDFSWKTQIETDVRMFAENLYFHVLAFPSETNIDPELFKTYWIKVDLAEIAKELSSGATPAQNENYGNIAGGQSSSFVGILTKDMPFIGGEKIASESISGISTTHFRLKSDPDKLALLVSDLYKKYTGKTYLIDDEGSVRLKNALMKLSIDVWVDEKTKTLVQVSISGNLNDDIVGVHAKGELAISFTLTGYGSQVVVTTPAPSLSLTDLRTRMDDYKKLKTMRARNLSRVHALTDITHALTSYVNQKGRLPLTLSELSGSGLLASSTFANNGLKSYVYAAYVKPNDFTKANKCTVKSKSCTSYHIGVDLDDITDPALTSDADVASEIHGEDSAGCAGGANLSCYDVIYPERVTTSSAP